MILKLWCMDLRKFAVQSVVDLCRESCPVVALRALAETSRPLEEENQVAGPARPHLALPVTSPE